MKTTAIALLTFFLLSFSFGHAQELKKVKKQLPRTKMTKKPTKKKIRTRRTATLNPVAQKRVIKKPVIRGKSLLAINNIAMRHLLEKKNASPFHIVEDGYPSEFDEPRNGNESKLVLQNDDGVYRILYRTDQQKEIAYYVYNNIVKSQYELFKFLIDINTYEPISNPDEGLISVFNEIGIKVLDNIDLIRVEENSVGCIRGTYEGNVYVYTDGEAWLDDGDFKSGFSGQ